MADTILQPEDKLPETKEAEIHIEDKTKEEHAEQPNDTAAVTPTPSPNPLPSTPLPKPSASASPEPEVWVCVVAFHHARGPEIESWYGVHATSPSYPDPAVANDWAFLPFMALSDGAHLSTEDFSYFTLRKKETGAGGSGGGSLFGMSCTRQIESRNLKVRAEDVTRSTVQKSLVVVAESAAGFGAWREKLSVVTRAWFAQRDFSDTEILKAFQESLVKSVKEAEDEKDQYLGLSLRELIHEFKHQTLVLLKCALLQPKMLFFGSRCERLCMIQFALVSLIPGLLKHLDDCADPELDGYERSTSAATSLRTSDRSSLLAYMGLPLQLFGKGSLFGPYTPLQQLDMLADYGTKSYIVGSTNSLLLQQKDRYSDILINLDDTTVTISSVSLRSALALTAADRRWIDALYGTISTNWDPNNPSRPLTHGYLGSEEFIRLQFEEYLLAMLSAVKYHQYLYAVPYHKRQLSAFADIEGDPSVDFGESWVEAWKQTSNFKLWNKITDSHLFDIVEPRHPTAGGLSIDDINRRFNQQIAELHLDERFATSKEAINKHLVVGQKKVSTAFNNLWSDIESLRAAQAAKRQQRKDPSETSSTPTIDLPSPSHFDISSPAGKTPSPSATPYTATFFDASSLRARAPDLTAAQAAVGAAGSKAGAYISSWGSWASERRRGWATGKGAGGTLSVPASGTSPGAKSAPPNVQRFEARAGESTPASLAGDKTPGSGRFVVGSEDGSPALTPTPNTPAVAEIVAKENGGRAMGEKEKDKDKDKRRSIGSSKSGSGSNGNGSPTKKSPRKTLSWKSGRSSTGEVIGSDGIGRLDA